MDKKRAIKGGAFFIARKLFKSELWVSKPASWKIIWIYILGNVSHTKTNNLERGEGFFQWTSELRSVGIDTHRDMIKKALFFFKKQGMVSTRRSTRGVYIKVLNYNTYQVMDSYSSTRESTKRSTKKAPEKHQRSTPINKNVKNIKNVKKRENTPSKSAKLFFKGVSDLNTKIDSKEAQETRLFLQSLEGKYTEAPKGLIWSEIKKFWSYWTELNQTGTKQRWEKQDAFQVDRRLITWFGKIDQFKRSEINNKETKFGKL